MALGQTSNTSEFLLGCPLLEIKSLIQFQEPLGKCQWNPLNHYLYQCAHLFLFVSYLAFNSIGGIFLLRCGVLVGSILYCLWAILVSCHLDAVIWNGLFIMVNLVHIIAIFYFIRPMKFPRHIQKVYDQLFKPLKVSPYQFGKILKCKWQIKDFSCETCYAIENFSKVEGLGIVLHGRFQVTKCSKLIHYVEAGQFIDSAEWFRVTSGEHYTVSVKAMVDSKVLMWNRDKLKLTFINDVFLQSVFNHVVSRDVAEKYFDSDNFAQIRCIGQNIKPLAIPNTKDENASSQLLHKAMPNVPPAYCNSDINDTEYDDSDTSRIVDYETTL